MYFSRRRLRSAAERAGFAAADIEPYRPLPPAAIARLKAGISGEVVVPGTPAYDLGRRLFNPKFNSFPVVIVYCSNEADIQLAYQVARQYGVDVAIRSGGHCTAGWSSSEGLLIDLSRINFAVVDPVGMSAVCSAGCTFETLNGQLKPTGLHVPGGTCPDVCIGGYMQGGGYGFTARVFGMNCDNVIAFRMMLADGTIVNASSDQNPELFWAVRGGMGGNYGVLIASTYQLVRMPAVSAFSIGWWFDTPAGTANAAKALCTMQQDMIHDSQFDPLGFQLAIANQGGTPATSRPCVMLKGMFVGSEEQGNAMRDWIANLPGADVQYSARGEYSDMNMGLMTHPFDVPQLPIDAIPNEGKEARYIGKPVPREAWQGLLDHFRATPSPLTIYGAEMYGARIARGPDQPNAFAHRGADLDFFCDVFWYDEADRAPMEEHLKLWTKLVQPYWNGNVYPNYPTANVDDYRTAYWGANFDRLLALKQQVDPDNVFHFSQSLSPRPPPPGNKQGAR